MIFYSEALRRRRAAAPRRPAARPRPHAQPETQQRRRSALSPSLLLLTVPLLLIPIATSLALIALLLTLICSRRARSLGWRAIEQLRGGWQRWRTGRAPTLAARELADVQAIQTCAARSGRRPGEEAARRSA